LNFISNRQIYYNVNKRSQAARQIVDFLMAIIPVVLITISKKDFFLSVMFVKETDKYQTVSYKIKSEPNSIL